MNNRHCTSCGRLCNPGERYCPSCGNSLDNSLRLPKNRRTNRYDESVREWFTSKTFKTLLTIGIIGGCCFASCLFVYYGALIGLLESLFSPSAEIQMMVTPQIQHAPTAIPARTATPFPNPFIPTIVYYQPGSDANFPYIAGEIDENHPIDENVKAALNAWLSTSAPVNTKYWFVTRWYQKEDGRIAASLVGVNLSYPEEEWSMTWSKDNKIVWIGAVEVFDDGVVIQAVSEIGPTPTQHPQPYIAGETQESNPIDESIKAALNGWLATSAPVDTPYWFVTYWNRDKDGRVFVSLAAVNLSSPDEMWHMTGEHDGTNKVTWFGSVEVIGTEVKLYSP